MRLVLKYKMTKNYKTRESREFWKAIGETINKTFTTYSCTVVISEDYREYLQKDRENVIQHCILKAEILDNYWVKLFLSDNFRRLPFIHPDEEDL